MHEMLRAPTFTLSRCILPDRHPQKVDRHGRVAKSETSTCLDPPTCWCEERREEGPGVEAESETCGHRCTHVDSFRNILSTRDSLPPRPSPQQRLHPSLKIARFLSCCRAYVPLSSLSEAAGLAACPAIYTIVQCSIVSTCTRVELVFDSCRRELRPQAAAQTRTLTLAPQRC